MPAQAHPDRLHRECLPLSGILAACWGIFLGFPVLRLRGDYLAIVTLAFGEIIRLVITNWVSLTGGPNGLYDIPFLWRSMRIKVLGATHDTMLLMHSLQPESLKSLGYCGSLYADECAWKNLGAHHKTIKKDDA